MLFVESPDGSADVHEVAAPLFTIGRSPDNQVSLDDPHISRHHAVIEFDTPFFIIRNLSHNASLVVNGKAVRFKSLVSGDDLRIGEYRLRFVSDRDYVDGVAQAIETRASRRAPLRVRPAHKPIRH